MTIRPFTDEAAKQAVIETIFSQKPTATGYRQSERGRGADKTRPFVFVGKRAISANLRTGEVRYFGGRTILNENYLTNGQPTEMEVDTCTHKEIDFSMAQRIDDLLSR